MKHTKIWLAVFMAPAVLAAAAWLAPRTADAMEITSDSISNGVLDSDSACEDHDGDDESPQISISDVPPGTTHFAIIMDDPDAKALDGKTWVHWNVVNIPVENTELESDETPPGVVQENDDEDEEYGGMCPTDGRHMYRIGVFALDEPIETDGDEAPEALTIEMLESEYGDQIIGSAVIEAAFP